MRSTPMKAVVEAMMNKRVNGDIKYVGMSMRSNLNYRDIFTSKVMFVDIFLVLLHYDMSMK